MSGSFKIPTQVYRFKACVCFIALNFTNGETKPKSTIVKSTTSAGIFNPKYFFYVFTIELTVSTYPVTWGIPITKTDWIHLFTYFKFLSRVSEQNGPPAIYQRSFRIPLPIRSSWLCHLKNSITHLISIFPVSFYELLCFYDIFQPSFLI